VNRISKRENSLVSATFDSNSGDLAPELAPERKKRRVKPAGSGRKRGQKNRVTEDVRKYFLERAKVGERLVSIASGRAMKVGPADDPRREHPTIEQQLKALGMILGRVAPELRATELSGPDGTPLHPVPELTLEAAARQIAFLLVAGRRKAQGGGGPMLEVIEGSAQRVESPAPQPLPRPVYTPPPLPTAEEAALAESERCASLAEDAAFERPRRRQHHVVMRRPR
jgi:hypothetical protein